jgi:hypothetical protein
MTDSPTATAGSGERGSGRPGGKAAGAHLAAVTASRPPLPGQGQQSQSGTAAMSTDAAPR